MLYLSKSKYCSLWQCPKILWMNKYKSEELVLDSSALARMEAGNEVGDLAMGLFGDYVEVTAYKGERLNLQKMIADTKAEMDKGTPVICEASFEFDGLYCAVDILCKEENGWAILEVKSSTKSDKEIYIADIAYQKYVLQNCGVNVTGTYLICIDSNYVLDGDLDINRLFKVTDVWDWVSQEEKNIIANLKIAERILKSETEPEIDISEHCKKPYDCGYWKYCSRHIPSPSVFDLYRLQTSKKFDYYRKGIITYNDLFLSGVVTNEKHLRQIEFALTDKGTYVDKDGIRDFLDTLSYPIYFLDFETEQPVIPKYNGTKPYQQIPFQYSLHYIESEDGELKHKE